MPAGVTRRDSIHYFQQSFWFVPPANSTIFSEPWFHMLMTFDAGHLYYPYSGADGYWWTPNYPGLPGDTGQNPANFTDVYIGWLQYMQESRALNPMGAHDCYLKVGLYSGSNTDGTTGGSTIFNNPSWTGGHYAGGTVSGFQASLYQNTDDKLNNTAVWPDSPVGTPTSAVSALNRFHSVFNTYGKQVVAGWVAAFASSLKSKLDQYNLPYPAALVNDNEDHLNIPQVLAQRANNGSGVFIQTGNLYAHTQDPRYSSEIVARGKTLQQLMGSDFSLLSAQSGLYYYLYPEPAEIQGCTLVVEAAEEQAKAAYYDPWLTVFPTSGTVGWKSLVVPNGQTLNQKPEIGAGSNRLLSQQSFCYLTNPTLPFYPPASNEIDAQFSGNPDAVRLTWLKRRKADALMMATGNPGKGLAAWMTPSGWGTSQGWVVMDDDTVIDLLDYMWSVGFRKIMWWADPQAEAIDWNRHATLCRRIDQRYYDNGGVNAVYGSVPIMRTKRGPQFTSKEMGVPLSAFDVQNRSQGST